MAIPKYQDMMYPIMKIIYLQRPIHMKEIIDELKILYSISDDEMSKMLPSGKSAYVKNRVGWAVTYLEKAGLLDRNKGFVTITERGIQIVNNPSISKLNNRILKRNLEIQSLIEGNKDKESESKDIKVIDVENNTTPIGNVYNK